MKKVDVLVRIEAPDGLPPIWPDKFLVAVANGGSFAQAANAAGVTPLLVRKTLCGSRAFGRSWRWCVVASKMPPRELLAALAEHAVDPVGRERLSDLSKMAM